jgi:hypothetical protein
MVVVSNPRCRKLQSGKPRQRCFQSTHRHQQKVDRFQTLDPLGFAGGDANLYRYVGNGPMTRRDPSGLEMFGDNDVPLSPSQQEQYDAAKKQLIAEFGEGSPEYWLHLNIVLAALLSHIESAPGRANPEYWHDAGAFFSVRPERTGADAFLDIWARGDQTLWNTLHPHDPWPGTGGCHQTGCIISHDFILIMGVYLRCVALDKAEGGHSHVSWSNKVIRDLGDAPPSKLMPWIDPDDPNTAVEAKKHGGTFSRSTDLATETWYEAGFEEKDEAWLKKHLVPGDRVWVGSRHAAKGLNRGANAIFIGYDKRGRLLFRTASGLTLTLRELIEYTRSFSSVDDPAKVHKIVKPNVPNRLQSKRGARVDSTDTRYYEGSNEATSK